MHRLEQTGRLIYTSVERIWAAMETRKVADLGAHFVDEILNTVETPIAFLDGDGKILRFNHACETITQFSESEVKGKKVWDFLIVDEEIDAIKEVFAKTRSEDIPTHFINYWKTKSGDRRLLRWSNKTLRRPDGELVGILASAIDITALIEAERDLSESQAFLRSIIDLSPIAIVTIDRNSNILTFSHSAESTFGYREAEIVGKNIDILMPPEFSNHNHEHLRRYLDTGQQYVVGNAVRVKGKRSDGAIFPAKVHVSEFLDGDRIFVAFIEDLSEKEETERNLANTQYQLQHAARVGAMGEIATSIAHELNQPLTAAASLVGAVSLRMKKGECPECKNSLPLLGDAVGEIRRASEIIQQMREFIRRKKTAKSLHNVNKIVEDAGALAIIGADADGIEVRWDMSPEVGDIHLDRIQIQQVVTNLIRNAIDAMKSMPKRVLTISTRRRTDAVEVRIADTGPGLSREMQRKLFEPFVSGKEEGMGVGLSIAKTIIDAHQGEIFASNRDSGGCVFTFRLPAGTYGRVGD